VANGNGTGNPTISLVDDVVLPGTGAVTIPIGTDAQEPLGSNGQLRYNSDQGAFYGFSAGSWRQFSTSGGVTEVNTGTGLQGGPITATGTISIDDTVVATLSGTQTLTNKTISGASNTITNVSLTTSVTGTLPVANGGSGVTTSTGSGNVVLSTSPTLVTPVLGTPTSGTLSNCTVDGTNSVGFRIIPQNSQSAAYTAVLDDSGRHILHPSADTTARTFTIPANGSVAYPIGTALTFINQNGAGTVTIAITSDTMRLAGAGTTGSRTLAANGVATAIKITATEWIISGTGLT